MTLLALALAAALGRGDGEARISLDVHEAEVVDVVRLLADLGDFQVVFDPGISCRPTLKLREARPESVLSLVLKTCGLGSEERDGILRVARLGALAEEARAERRLKEARAARSGRSVSYRLSYARAAEMAPIVARLLPGAEVAYDQRTNTLMIVD